MRAGSLYASGKIVAVAAFQTQASGVADLAQCLRPLCDGGKILLAGHRAVKIGASQMGVDQYVGGICNVGERLLAAPEVEEIDQQLDCGMIDPTADGRALADKIDEITLGCAQRLDGNAHTVFLSNIAANLQYTAEDRK